MMEKNLEKNTGKTLNQWLSILDKQSFVKHGEYLTFLKNEHGITHGFANFIAHKHRKSDAASSDSTSLLKNQYQNKEQLKPIYDLLLKQIEQLGADVEIVPKKAAVSARVKRQFALIQPTTKTRIDLGLKLNQTPYSDRLGSSGPFGSMCSHRVQLNSIDQIDSELMAWLKIAYEQAR